MSKENTAGLGVNSRYGPLTTPDGAGGVIKTEGAVNELTLDFTGETINDDSEQNPVIPAGSLIIAAYAEISEAFVLGGTTPTIDIGTKGSEGTNGIDIADAGEADTVGTYDILGTPSGTWAASLAANTTVGIALGGTSPTVTSAGKARVVVQYLQV
jgi:hypothetical protein